MKGAGGPGRWRGEGTWCSLEPPGGASPANTVLLGETDFWTSDSQNRKKTNVCSLKLLGFVNLLQWQQENNNTSKYASI